MAKVGDYGTPIRAEITDNGAPYPIPDGATLTLTTRSPSGVIATHTAVVATDGLDGVIQYVTIEGDLNEAGAWQVEGVVTLAGGAGRWKSDSRPFTVGPGLSAA